MILHSDMIDPTDIAASAALDAEKEELKNGYTNVTINGNIGCSSNRYSAIDLNGGDAMVGNSCVALIWLIITDDSTSNNQTDIL